MECARRQYVVTRCNVDFCRGHAFSMLVAVHDKLVWTAAAVLLFDLMLWRTVSALMNQGENFSARQTLPLKNVSGVDCSMAKLLSMGLCIVSLLLVVIIVINYQLCDNWLLICCSLTSVCFHFNIEDLLKRRPLRVITRRMVNTLTWQKNLTSKHWFEWNLVSLHFRWKLTVDCGWSVNWETIFLSVYCAA